MGLFIHLLTNGILIIINIQGNERLIGLAESNDYTVNNNQRYD